MGSDSIEEALMRATITAPAERAPHRLLTQREAAELLAVSVRYLRDSSCPKRCANRIAEPLSSFDRWVRRSVHDVIVQQRNDSA